MRSYGPIRAHEALDAWLVRRLLSGVHPRAIAAASGGAMSLRTAYRWRREIRGLEEVRVGEHVATFVLRDGHPPTRIEPWRDHPSSVRRARAMQGIRCGAWMPIVREPCARFSGHRSQCKGRSALDDAARVERDRRGEVRRAKQRAPQRMIDS